MFNKIFVWTVVVVISITLIFTSFDFSKKKLEKNFNVIDNYSIIDTELVNIISYLKDKYKLVELNEVTTFTDKLKIFILNDIRVNIKFVKLGLIVANKDIKNEILYNYLFRKDNKFSIDLYKEFLLKNEFTDGLFQQYLIKKLKISRFKKNIQVFCITYLVNAISVLKYHKYKIDYLYSLNSIKKNFLYKDFFLRHELDIVKLNFLNISIKEIIKHCAVDNFIVIDIYNKNKYIYNFFTDIKISHIKISRRIKNYFALISLLKDTNNLMKLQHNKYFAKVNLLIDPLEFNVRFKIILKRYDTTFVFFESVSDFHILIYKNSFLANKFSVILDDIKNKCKKEKVKNKIFKSKLFNFDFNATLINLNLPISYVYVDPYVRLKEFEIFNKHLKKKIVIINKYNYLILNTDYIGRNSCDNYLDVNIKAYFNEIKSDKKFLTLFFINDVNLYDMFDYKFIRNKLIKDRFKLINLHKYNNKYYYFYIDNYVEDVLCDYQTIVTMQAS
ncbi:MAG TPA: hypothetical protein V7792_01205 [Candidatus Azoamicus sp. OHIO2]